MDKKTIELIKSLRRDIMRLKDAAAAKADVWGYNHCNCEIMRIEENIIEMGGCPDTTGGPISWAEIDEDIYYDMFG